MRLPLSSIPVSLSSPSSLQTAHAGPHELNQMAAGYRSTFAMDGAALHDEWRGLVEALPANCPDAARIEGSAVQRFEVGHTIDGRSDGVGGLMPKHRARWCKIGAALRSPP